MKTLADLVNESENKEYEDLLIIKYIDSSKDFEISPKAVIGDSLLEKFLPLEVHAIRDLFIVLADEQPLRFKNLLYGEANNTAKIGVKLIIYESGKKNEITKNDLVSLILYKEYMELEIIKKNGEYILDVDLQTSS